MKRFLLLAGLAMPVFAQQAFDFSQLDKLGAGAKNKTNITLDNNMLKLASGILGSEKEEASVKNLVSGLNAITIRSYEFEKPGRYAEADIEPFRAWLKQQKWSRIVDSVEGAEHSEIYVQPQANNKVGGLAVISAEPLELTVVYIDGPINMDDIGKLGGNMGIPNIRVAPSDKKSDRNKKEE